MEMMPRSTESLGAHLDGPPRAGADVLFCPCCQIINIPDEMRENGVGPLISAKAVDEDIIWDRLDQMRNACEIVRPLAPPSSSPSSPVA